MYLKTPPEDARNSRRKIAQPIRYNEIKRKGGIFHIKDSAASLYLPPHMWKYIIHVSFQKLISKSIQNNSSPQSEQLLFKMDHSNCIATEMKAVEKIKLRDR